MPIRSTNIIKALTGLLSADATFSNQVTHGVHAHRLPETPSDTTWSRAVVRELALPQGLSDHPTGLTTLPIQIVIECAGYPDPDLLLEAAHETASDLLSGQTPQTAYGRVLVPIERGRRPTVPQWDEKTQSYWSTASYYITAAVL